MGRFVLAVAVAGVTLLCAAALSASAALASTWTLHTRMPRTHRVAGAVMRMGADVNPIALAAGASRATPQS
jgi:hypothetical protein